MRSAALMVAFIGACAGTGAQAPVVVQARADAPLPGPCASEESGPEGRTRIAYEYDARRRLVREIERGPSHTVQRLWIHDELGRRARELVVEGERLHAIWYVYDERGLLVATEEDATGKRDVVTRNEREYDARGKLVRMGTTRDGALVEEHALHYDDVGRLAFEIVVRGGRSEVVDIDLDPAGRIVVRRSEREVQRFAYAMTGRLETMTVERGGHPHLVRRFAYDEAGNLVQAETLDADGRPVRTMVHTYACW